MTEPQHPITPPSERFKQWEDDILNERDNVDHVLDCAWKDGFLAGADQELEACCEWTQYCEECGDSLRAARRPKPPSVKEQALDALDRMDQFPTAEDQRIIRRALAQLPDE